MALQREGYNPAVVKEPIFMLDSAKGSYRPLDAQLYQELQDQGVRI